MHSTKSESKQRVFKGGFHSETAIVLVVPFIVALALFLYGLRHNTLFPPGVDLFTRILFVFAPIILGLTIVIISIVTLITNLMVKITVTPNEIHYQQGSKEFTCGWKVLAFAPPPPNRKFLKTFSIGDGTILARVNSAYFPKFDKLVKFMKMAKKKAEQGGYTL